MAKRYCPTCRARTEPCRGVSYDDRPAGSEECSECGDPYELEDDRR